MAGSKKIDWGNHFLGFVVVVIGILMAFQLNTCSENKKEKALVEAHINAVIAETHFNKNRMEYAIAQTEELQAKIDSLLSFIQTERNFGKMNTLSLQLLNLEPIYIKKNSYNSLVETGDIRYVKNFNLRNDIVNLYEAYNWAESVDGMTHKIFLEHYYPYILENLDMLERKIQDNDRYTNKYFKNVLVIYKFSLDQRKHKFMDTKKITTNFLEGYDR